MVRVLLVVALAVSGCALTPDLIRLEPPAPVSAPLAGAERIELRLAVDDLRPEQTQVVARKINGFGMRMADITNDEPIADVLARAARTALSARGFHVVENGQLTLVLELLVFSHEFRTGMWSGRSEALVIFLATVRDPDGRERFRRVVSQPFSHSIQLASGANVKKAYEQAIAEALEALLSDPAFLQSFPSTAPPVL